MGESGASTAAPMRVLVGITGRPGSKQAARKLLESGADVVGATIVCGQSQAWQQVEESAAETCRELGVSHTVIHAEGVFEREVIAQAARDRARRLEPDVEALFTSRVLLSQLAWAADTAAYTHIATGHVARIRHRENSADASTSGEPPANDENDTNVLLDKQCRPIVSTAGHTSDAAARFELGRIKDAAADQSRLLAAVDASLLERLLLPNCEPTEQTPRLAPELVEAEVLIAQAGASDLPGDIVDKAGNVIGHHEGLSHYRLKQLVSRIASDTGESLYVVRKNAPMRHLVVGTAQQAQASECLVNDINWLIEPPVGQTRVLAQLAQGESPVAAMLEVMGGMAMLCGSVGALTRLMLDKASINIVPGQLAAFYDENGRAIASGFLA